MTFGLEKKEYSLKQIISDLTAQNNIRENLSNLRKEIKKIKKDISKLITAKKEGKTKDYLEKMIEKMVSENYIILAKMLGEPPLEINFEYRNKDNVLISKKLTPQEFYHRYSLFV